MLDRHQRLFRAVVVSGAAITACQANPKLDTAAAAPEHAAPGATAVAATTLSTLDPQGARGAPASGGLPRQASDAAHDPQPCPPGSERSFPPCYMIR
jgi:hypothetical protein